MTTTGINLIAWERKRQMEREGWTAEHDDQHMHGELAKAAACYAVAGHWDVQPGGLDEGLISIRKILVALWPATWATSWWKPRDKKRNLIRAGALIAAELDRMERQEARARGAAGSPVISTEEEIDRL